MKYHEQHPRFVAGFLALSGLALGLVVAREHGLPTAAADDKIFAIQYCVPIDPDTGGFGNAGIGSVGFEQTESLAYQTFICPLVRDAVTGTLDDVWVRVSNESQEDEAGTPPRCCVHSVSLGGSGYDFECRATPDVDGDMSLRLTLDDFTEFDYGHYTVTCELGLEDSIRSIRTSESP